MPDAAAPAHRRPNILLIQSDQHRADCLGPDAHGPLETPRLDRLAAEGVRFTHAFTPVPVCVPARNSLLYGRWPTQHGVIANPDTEAPRPAPPSLPTWSEALRAAGYWLGYVGKWHVHPTRTPRDYGWHAYVGEGGYHAWREARGMPPLPRANGWLGETDKDATPETSRLGWGADETIRMLEAGAASGGPFFVRWDPSEPHLPNVVPEPFASLYRPGDVPPWPNFADPLTDKPFIQAQMRRTWGVDGWTWDDWSPLVARYLATVALLDAQIGRVLDALDRLGLTDSTLVVYTSDHGDMSGSHGMLDKHYVMYDDVTRVPLIVRWPGRVAAPGSEYDAFTTHALDLAATFCDAAGVDTPPGFVGRSLVPTLAGGADAGPEYVFAQYFGAAFGLWSQRMARDKRWKYVFNAAAGDELYDLSTDPGEIVNRAADPSCAAELARLRGALVGWMESIGDPLLNQWTRPVLLGERTKA